MEAATRGSEFDDAPPMLPARNFSGPGRGSLPGRPDVELNRAGNVASDAARRTNIPRV